MRDYSQPLRLIEILADGAFHSGEELGLIFCMSRAGINKHIQTLKSWGIELDSVPKKGYCLNRALDLLKVNLIRQYYRGVDNCQLFFEPIIGSTNQYLLDRTSTLNSGDACISEFQQTGRGRRGRQWFSPFGSNIYLSIYWRLEQGPAAAVGLSLVIGIVVAKILRQLSEQDVRVKWPNDLYLNDKKLAGILVEMSGKTGDHADIVIGCGINLMMSNPNQQIVNQPWSNLGEINRNLLVSELLATLRETLVKFEQQGLDPFIEKWNQLDNFLNRPVRLLIGDKVISGIARGINAQGALQLEQNGTITSFVGGEISLRAD